VGLGEGVGLEEADVDNEVADDFLGLGEAGDQVAGLNSEGLEIGELFVVGSGEVRERLLNNALLGGGRALPGSLVLNFLSLLSRGDGISSDRSLKRIYFTRVLCDSAIAVSSEICHEFPIGGPLGNSAVSKFNQHAVDSLESSSTSWGISINSHLRELQLDGVQESVSEFRVINLNKRLTKAQ